eukprot:2497460-Rhodomonas_salina.1
MASSRFQTETRASFQLRVPNNLRGALFHFVHNLQMCVTGGAHTKRPRDHHGSRRRMSLSAGERRKDVENVRGQTARSPVGQPDSE